MHIAPELLPLGNPPHRCYNPITNNERTNIPAFAFLHKLLDKHVLLLALQELYDGFRGFHGFRQQYTDTLGTLNQFDDHGCTANPFNGGDHVFLVPDKGGSWNPDMVPTQNLQAAQLVPGIDNAVCGIGAENVHLLELPYDSRSVVGNGCADPGKYGIVVIEHLLPIVKVRDTLLQINGELQGIQDGGFMIALLRCLDQTPGAVGPGRAG